jgi:hypothetical protein
LLTSLSSLVLIPYHLHLHHHHHLHYCRHHHHHHCRHHHHHHHHHPFIPYHIASQGLGGSVLSGLPKCDWDDSITHVIVYEDAISGSTPRSTPKILYAFAAGRWVLHGGSWIRASHELGAWALEEASGGKGGPTTAPMLFAGKVYHFPKKHKKELGEQKVSDLPVDSTSNCPLIPLQIVR